MFALVALLDDVAFCVVVELALVALLADVVFCVVVETSAVVAVSVLVAFGVATTLDASGAPYATSHDTSVCENPAGKSNNKLKTIARVLVKRDFCDFMESLL